MSQVSTDLIRQLVDGSISRDDYGGFINHYKENDIIPSDPFQTIDQDGVGNLMKQGVKGGRSTRENIKLGICGEHGGDPASVIFCHEIGLNYVSCSPFRVPVARLAAAQAAVAARKAAAAAAAAVKPKKPRAEKAPAAV